MKKVVLTILGILGLAASANAQGTWYTVADDWAKRLTAFSAGTNYDTNIAAANSITLGDVIATATGPGTVQSIATPDGVKFPGYLQASADTPVTFSSANLSVASNAFAGFFQTTSSGSIDFYINGSLTSVYGLSTSTSNYSFIGYISDSASPITMKVSPNSGNSIKVFEIALRQGTNPANPGSNVAPEPGSLALAITGGCALVGMFIRRRRRSN
jgi:hypothetical protein